MLSKLNLMFALRYVGRFTIDVIATTAYGLKIDPHRNHNSQFVVMAKKIFNAIEFNVGYVITCECNFTKLILF